MNRYDEIKDDLEKEIIDKLIDDVEVRILEKKEQLLNLGVEFANIIAKEKTSGSIRFKDDAENALEEIREQYMGLIQEVSQDIKIHHYLKVNQETILQFFNGWLRSKHHDIARFNEYIEKSFNRQKLDDK